MATSVLFQRWLSDGDNSKCGIASLRSKNISKNTISEYAFKVSKYASFAANHEARIMESLRVLSPFCINFVTDWRIIKTPVDIYIASGEYDELGHPASSGDIFDIKHKKDEILFAEYVRNAQTLSDYIADMAELPTSTERDAAFNVVFSAIKQVLCALVFAQAHVQFVHFDLHTVNILLEPCDPNIVFVYNVGDAEAFLVPSYGFIARIIDYGCAYSQVCENAPCLASLSYMDTGCIPVFDPFYDARTLLSTILGDFDENVDWSVVVHYQRLAEISNVLFDMCSFDWSTGWDDLGITPATTELYEQLTSDMDDECVFRQYTQICMDLLHAHIELPLTGDQTNLDVLTRSFSLFAAEFAIIEQQSEDCLSNTYILKEIVRQAHLGKRRKDFLTNPANVASIVRAYFNPVGQTASIDCDWQLLLLSLYTFEENITTYLFHKLTQIVAAKNADYAKLEINGIDGITAFVHLVLPDEVQYTVDHVFHLFDSVAGCMVVKSLGEEQLSELNNLTNVHRASFVMKS